MRAQAGDNLLAGSGAVAIIVKVLGADGHPPYIVKWLPAGNIAMVDPDPYARVMHAADPPGDALKLARSQRLIARPADPSEDPDPLEPVAHLAGPAALLGQHRQLGRLLGDIDADRAPGDAPAAVDAS